MDFFALKNISEQYMELVNPISPEKIIKLGRLLGMRKGSRVIDFGCGYAEPLILWAENFGIAGIGIDVREYACDRAQKKLAEKGLSNQIEIVCGNAADHPFVERSFDVATCLGASFVWGGFRPTIRAMSKAIRPGGRLGIGEPYWLTDRVPVAYARQESGFHHEIELLHIAREEGFDLAGVIRASHDDWDRYESDNWHGLIRWLEDNPDHPEREEVIQHLHQSQEEYLTYGRDYLGWAMYVLSKR